MIGIYKGKELFCDLYCYACGGYRQRTCLLFGDLPFFIGQAICMAEHKVLSEFKAQGMWSHKLDLTPKDTVEIKAPIYFGESVN